MKKTYLASIIFIVIVLVATVFALSQKTEAPEPDNSTQTSRPTSSGAESQSENSKPTANYVDYSDEAVANADGQKVIFFHAPWCPQCRAIEADILEQGVPSGYTILKVDYDTNQDLRQKYGVTLQTTFVKIDDQDNGTDKYVAYDEPTLDAVKREFLN